MSELLLPPTKITNADQILFRAHSNGEFMDSKDMNGFTLGQLTELAKIFSSAMGREEKIDSKYLAKGNERENDSLTLLSCIEKIVFNKNETRISNEFITAIPDGFTGESIYKAIRTIDTKTSFSLKTFAEAKLKNADKKALRKTNGNFYWQGQSAMGLTGAESHTTAFCLVNGTAKQIIKEKTFAKWKYDAVDPDVYPEYQEECKQIELNHLFDFEAFYKENQGFDFHNDFDTLIAHNIPMEERLHTVVFERNEDEIKALYERVKICRKFMNEKLFTL